MPHRALPVSCIIALAVALAPASAAADEAGCCQFFSRSATASTHSRGTRQCADLTRQECTLTRAPSTFFRGFHCNTQTARCGLGPPATLFAVPTPTPTASPVPLGCCQLDSRRSTVCGNQVTERSCLNDFEGQPTFCADCVCSSHSGPGFDLSQGQCVTRTPTPTVTPADPRGCCQLDNLRGTRSSVCGNAITRSSCLNDFDAQPTFCADCACTSHADAGFDLAAPGACRGPAPTPRGHQSGHPRPARRPGHS